ncbi:MAG: DNA alkylation repair protein [Candidatus Sumerlaeia bacterium]
MPLQDLIDEARALADPVRAEAVRRYFKTGDGEYGEGDQFLGLTAPACRAVCKKYADLKLPDIGRLIKSAYHEERAIALLILVIKFGRADASEQTTIFNFYVKHKRWINNWDLVDISAPKIMGAYLFERAPEPLFEFAKSPNLWERRMAIVASLYFIKHHDCDTTLRLAEILMADRHDLIHKATGWMLREVGKESTTALIPFLNKHAAGMPRTMLRYAIEKFPAAARKQYLAIRPTRHSD